MLPAGEGARTPPTVDPNAAVPKAGNVVGAGIAKPVEAPVAPAAGAAAAAVAPATGAGAGAAPPNKNGEAAGAGAGFAAGTGAGAAPLLAVAAAAPKVKPAVEVAAATGACAGAAKLENAVPPLLFGGLFGVASVPLLKVNEAVGAAVTPVPDSAGEDFAAVDVAEDVPPNLKVATVEASGAAVVAAGGAAAVAEVSVAAGVFDAAEPKVKPAKAGAGAGAAGAGATGVALSAGAGATAIDPVFSVVVPKVVPVGAVASAAVEAGAENWKAVRLAGRAAVAAAVSDTAGAGAAAAAAAVLAEAEAVVPPKEKAGVEGAAGAGAGVDNDVPPLPAKVKPGPGVAGAGAGAGVGVTLGAAVAVAVAAGVEAGGGVGVGEAPLVSLLNLTLVDLGVDLRTIRLSAHTGSWHNTEKHWSENEAGRSHDGCWVQKEGAFGHTKRWPHLVSRYWLGELALAN